MNETVIRALREAGVETDVRKSIPSIAIRVEDKDNQALSLEDDVPIATPQGGIVFVAPPRISEVLTGTARPPELREDLQVEYIPFFATIEMTAAEFCVATKRAVTDKEFEELYETLRRRPDSRHPDPLFWYLQAAVRIYASLVDVSREEFEAVVRRLAKSARTFHFGYTSRNYLETALLPLLGDPDEVDDDGDVE